LAAFFFIKAAIRCSSRLDMATPAGRLLNPAPRALRILIVDELTL
jgi:hypothetical protein